MLMPETTMHEYHFIQRWKDNIRVPGQTSTMEPIAIAETKEKAPNLKFRRHVLASNSPHVLTAAIWRDGIDHGLS